MTPLSVRRAGVLPWPALWVASEGREVLHLNPVSSPPRSARVPKGLVHAVNRDTPAIELTTVCGQPLDHLIQFPHYNFEATSTRTSRLVTLCPACQPSNGSLPHGACT
jgi:hypothetical protein